ncbi:probable serine carboxypeptidase CPVL isoform X1 [Halichondria panicea]|uniref:probable serine carboxypeptidase CPVL isoform X1 n=1 Tax=Halichondria panicea TaxID=6063 RepID=UPI00312B2FFD
MADENQATYIYSRTNTAEQYIKAERFYDGFKIFDALLNGDLIPYPTYLYNITGSTTYYNILRTSLASPDFNYYVPFINTTDIRRTIHVGSLSYGYHAEVDRLKIGDDVAGYVRTVNKFMQVVVRGGGHILPFDQPERALNLIQNFVNMQ